MAVRPSAPLTVEFVTGRLRWARHLLVAAVGASSAYAWFGMSGLLPVLLWAWHRCPRPGRVMRWTIGPPTSAQLGTFRTVAWSGRRERLEVFHDEIAPEALATLRRHLKAVCSAGDGSQHVEPV